MGNELSNILPKFLARVQKATTTIFVNCNTTVFPKTGLFLCEQQHWAIPDSCPFKYQHKDVIWALFALCEWQHQDVLWSLLFCVTPRCVLSLPCFFVWQHQDVFWFLFVWMATPRCGPDPCLFEWQHQTVSWLLFVWMATPRCALILACVNGNA